MSNQKGKYETSAPVTLRGVTLSFAKLARAEKPKGRENDPTAKAKRSANFILDPQQHAAEIKACKEAINDALKRAFPAAPNNRPPKMKPIICFGKAGADTGLMCYTAGEVYDGYDGKWFVAGKSKNDKQSSITLADRSGNILSPDEIEEVLYSGAVVNASVEFTAAEDANGQYVYCVIRGVRFVRDGERFGGGGGASLDELGGIDEENGDDGFG